MTKIQPTKLTQPLNGHLTAVGVGPGDPELITVKGVKAIQAARLIFTPRSQDDPPSGDNAPSGDGALSSDSASSGEDGQSLALRIAQGWINPAQQEIVELALPMTRDADRLRLAWRAAADRIAASFSEYQTREAPPIRGVYLLLGDPLLYGTFTYIWGELAEYYPEIRIDIVPGVTSFAAAAARGRFVLSTTSDRVAILPASYETNAAQLRRLLADYDTIILMKVGRVFAQVLAALEEMELLDSTLYAERVGMPEERIVPGPDLRQLRHQRRPYLSLLIVRKETGKARNI
jgi:precorrin-2/cobalt-factor-2 C20-methyltransferase